jgi:hypothetical protein
MNSLQTQVWEALGRVPGMLEGESVFSSGAAYWVNRKQVAHVTDNGELELRLTKPVIRELATTLKSDSRVELRRGPSDWVILHPASAADIDFVIGLATRAADAHLPADGRPIRPPPTGPDLARRRRFH